jgi:hypothetical protein
MADICKCLGKRFGKDCYLKDICYRYTAPVASEWQAYIAPSEEENPCALYWPVKEKRSQKNEN